MTLAAPEVLRAESVPDVHAPHLVLWNTEAFAALRPGLVESRLVVDHHDDASGRFVGSVVGIVDDGVWTSGASAPFGGIDLAREHEPVDGVMALLDRSIASAKDAGLRRIEIRTKPPHFSTSEPHVQFALFQAGFTVIASDLNFVLDLDGLESVDEWRASLRKETRRALRALGGDGLTVRELDRADELGWATAYEMLRNNRVDKGRPMHLDLDYVRAIRDAFAGLVRMIVVESDDSVVAAALVYRIARGRDLVQYWGDGGHELERSPMPALVEAVVDHSLRTGARSVDIGISTDHGEPNLGLIRFKRSVGCRAEVRLVLALDLEVAR